jgi:hypothetical protein
VIDNKADYILFQLEQYDIDMRVARQLLDHVKDNIELRSYVSDETGDMVVRLILNAYVSNSTEYVEFPDSWFDMFKIKYYPTWLLKKFPPKINQRILQKKSLLVDGKTAVAPFKKIMKYPEPPKNRIGW